MRKITIIIEDDEQDSLPFHPFPPLKPTIPMVPYQPGTADRIIINEPRQKCLHEELDKQEIAAGKTPGPRMLSCPCPKCTPYM